MFQLKHDIPRKCKCTLAIFRGCDPSWGASRRMGFDKAFALLGGQPLIAHVCDRLAVLKPERLFIVANPPLERLEALGVPTVADNTSVQTPLAGILTALQHCDAPAVLVVACDMPFLEPSMLHQLVNKHIGTGALATVPIHADHVQGLCAVYSQDCIPSLTAFLDAGGRGVRDYLAGVDVGYMMLYAGDSFFNINTPEDLALARSIMRARRDGV